MMQLAQQQNNSDLTLPPPVNDKKKKIPNLVKIADLKIKSEVAGNKNKLDLLIFLTKSNKK